ncbi:MAG: hypothetical protein JW751_24730 [Polyangiaceae bacterium]|nr:hypothetical protein [Polyangiaceae bacterium]
MHVGSFHWSGAGANEVALTDLLVHELGHVLGLAHDCDAGLAKGPRPARRPLTNPGLPAAARQSRAFVEAVNVHEGRLTNAAVAQAFDMSWSAYVP